MGKKYFKITFTRGTDITVCALNKAEAKILAQARKIRTGNNYKVIKIEIIKK